MKSKHKAIIFFFGLVILLLRPIVKFYNMEWFYNKFSWIIILIIAFFGVTLIIDFGAYLIKKAKKVLEDKKYKNYILHLSDEKLDIVKKLYQNPPQYKGYLHENDPNVLELFRNQIITRLKRRNYVRESTVEDLNDPPILYILQPHALEIIKANEKNFK